MPITWGIRGCDFRQNTTDPRAFGCARRGYDSAIARGLSVGFRVAWATTHEPLLKAQTRTERPGEAVEIPSGVYTMGHDVGAPSELGSRSDEAPQHVVHLDRFWIGTFEVTWYEYKKYMGEPVAEWEAQVTDDGTYRYTSSQIECPLTERGAYVVEALIDNGVKSFSIVMLQDTAVVEKNLTDRKLYYVCDSITGKPIEGIDLGIYAYSYRWDRKGKRNQLLGKFDEYRRNKWPEDVKPDNRDRFLEEVMVRVSFWMLSAHQVGALK